MNYMDIENNIVLLIDQVTAGLTDDENNIAYALEPEDGIWISVIFKDKIGEVKLPRFGFGDTLTTERLGFTQLVEYLRSGILSDMREIPPDPVRKPCCHRSTG
jgi:hypothetical protein